MKQTSNAIKFLLAQYRSIFKNAYFKGLATAVVVTAGLAAAQGAQAADYWYSGDGTTFTRVVSSPSGTSSNKAVGAFDTGASGSDFADTTDGIGVGDGIATDGVLNIGTGTNNDLNATSGSAYGGYVSLDADATFNAITSGNEVHLNSGGRVGEHLVGGWAVSKGSGLAIATGNTVTIDKDAGNLTNQTIGGWASSLTGATASTNEVKITGTTGFSLADSVFGGIAAAESGSTYGTFRADGNKLSISDASFAKKDKMVVGGYAISQDKSNTSTAESYSATGNTVTLTNVVLSGDSSSAIVAANYADGQGTRITVGQVTANGVSGEIGLTITNGSYVKTTIYGGAALTAGSATEVANATANANSVSIKGANLQSGSVMGGYVYSSGSTGFSLNANDNSVVIANTDVENFTTTSQNENIFGAYIKVAEGAGNSGSSITANRNSVSIGSQYKFGLDASNSGSSLFGARIDGDSTKSGSTILMQDNSLTFDGVMTGNIESGQSTTNKGGFVIGAMNNANGSVKMTDNSVTINGQITSGSIVAAYNTSNNKDGAESVYPVMTGNSVTIGKDAKVYTSDIYAVYNANAVVAKNNATNNDVTVSGLVSNSNIFGGIGSDSVITLDATSKFEASAASATTYNIQSDVVDLAGELTIRPSNTVQVAGYNKNGELGSDIYNTNSTTIADTAKIYSYGGSLLLKGETDVAEGATLAALATGADITVDGSDIVTKLDQSAGDLNYNLTGGTAAVVISEQKLHNYLNGGQKLTINGAEHETVKGALVVTSGGAADFRESVTLSNFDFANTTETAGKIKVDDTLALDQDKGSVFRADTVTVAHALLTDNSKLKDLDDITGIKLGTTDGIAIEADTLNLGSNTLTSKQSEDITFGRATAKNEINFIALSSGTDNNGQTNDGYHLTSTVVGSNYMETKDQNAGRLYYTALDGVIRGDVTAVSDGELFIQDGNWTAQDSVTIASGGTLNVGKSDNTGSAADTTGGINAPDATLSLSQGLTVDVATALGEAKITVTGLNGGFYPLDYTEHLDSNSENTDNQRVALLDLRSGLTMVGADGNGDIKGKATITATQNGIVLLDAHHVNTILSQNDTVVEAERNTKGAVFKGTSSGAFIVTGDVVADFDDFGTTNNGFNLDSSSYLVADSLTVNNEGDTKDTAQDEKGYEFNSVSFGGNVVVDDLNVSDLQTTTGTSKPNVDSQYASYVTIMNGTAHVANSVTSINDTLVLGSGTDAGVNAAHIVLDSSLTTDQGTVNVDNLRVDNGSVRVTNGTWDATATTFNLNSATAEMVIGNNSDQYSHDEDEAGNDTFAILNAAALRMAAGSKLVVEADGEATFARADLSSLTTQQTDDGITVYGSLTIDGDTSATIASGDTTVDDPRNGVAFGAEGSIIIGNNGVLKFGKAATTGAIIAPATDSRYNDAAEVTASMVKGYSKINNNGGELHLGLGSGTVFSAEAILQLKNELFTAGSMTGGVLNHGGVLNIGDASFEGITNPVAFEGPGRSGYTATWDSVKKFSDVYGTDVANNTLTQTNISGIKVGDAIQGHWGSLRMSTDADTGAKVTIAGNTSLRFAEGNNGFFISNDSSSAALGANVQSQKSLTLQNGGTIGAVTLQEGQDNVEKNLTTLKVKGAGETTIASVNGVTNSGTKGSNATRLYVTGANNLTTVTGDITNVAYVDVEDGAALTAANASVDELSTINSTITITNKAEFDNFYVLGGKISVKDAVYTNENIVGNSHNDDDFVIVNGGTFTAETFKFQRASQLNIGADLTAEEATLEDGTVMNGTGYFEAQVLELNDGRLVVDPAYGELTSVAAIGKFQTDDRQTYKYDNDKGVVEGSLLVGKNAVLGVGASIAETLDAISTYQENGSLSADKYGSILYLNGQLTLGNSTSEIALNANADVSTVDGIRDSLKYTVSANELDREADLGLGANTAILMTEQAFEDDKGDKTGVAITFNRNNAVVNGAGGEIVLVGSFDAAQPLNFFKDNDAAGSEGVSIQGSIKVYTQNGFLFTTLEGENAGYGERLEVDTDRAYQVMSDASDPVVASLISYHVDRGGAVAGEDNSQESGASIPASKLTPAAKTSSDTLASRSGPILGEDTGSGDNSGDAGTGGDTGSGSGDAGNGGTGGDTGTTNPGHKLAGSSTFLNEVVTTSHGAPAEAVARMALYGGAVQAAIAANTSSYEAIAARTGVGATDMGLTIANNGMGAALWLAPMYKNQDSDSFDAEGLSYGVDMDLYGVALGADFEFMPGLNAGIMFNVGSGSADGQGSAAAEAVSNDFDYYGISVYGNYKYDALSITADLGYTAVDSDIDAHTGLESYGSVSTSVDSTAWTLGVTGKYTFNLGGVELAPHAGLRYSSIDLDDYSVSDIASYDADTMDIFSIPVGVTIAKEFSGEAWTVKPSLDLSVQGNFGDDTSDGTVHWTGVDGLATNVSSEMMDNFTYGATLGVSAQTGSFSMGLGVNYTGSDNVDEFGVNANARFVF